MTTPTTTRWLDATDCRLKRAIDADRTVVAFPTYTSAGLPTGGQRREIFSILDSLFKRDRPLILEEEWLAGNHYLFLYRKNSSHTRVTMKWIAHVDGWRMPPDPMVIRDHSTQSLAGAARAVHPAGRQALVWLTQNEWDDIGLAELGESYPGPMSFRERGRAFLRLALNDLGLYFGFVHGKQYFKTVSDIENSTGQKLRRF